MPLAKPQTLSPGQTIHNASNFTHTTTGQDELGRVLYLGDGCADFRQVGEEGHTVLKGVGELSGVLARRMAAGRWPANGEEASEKGTPWESHAELQKDRGRRAPELPGLAARRAHQSLGSHPLRASELCLNLSWDGESLSSQGRLSTLTCVGDSVSRHWAEMCLHSSH